MTGPAAPSGDGAQVPEDPANGVDAGRTDHTEVSPDAHDHRMADLLAKNSSTQDIRRQLETENSDASEDLLSRCNVLEFVSGCVGEVQDMPERLGAYRIMGLLGRGGMGTVYLAYQEDLEREVALKVLATSWSADPTMRQRFRAEARATAALHHRHIVPIYDYGEAQGRLFFAMERVDGSSLDKMIAAARRRGVRPLEPQDAARRFAGVADALGLAHRRRLLHRDVKPGNILVAQDGTLQLTDFGLAKALDQGSMRLTSKSGGFLGTLHYSSPEQAIGRDLTPASDLYALGVTLFEAVTGEMPLVGKTTEAVLQSLLHGEPRRLREALPKPPRDLEAVLDKLLSREPGDRYQDGEALARDLQRIADGDPVHIRRQPLLVRLYRRVRKNPVLSGAIVAATVLLVVTFGLLRVLRQEKDQSLVSRHQNNLVAVVSLVRAEAGSPFGPAPLLHSLVGGDAFPAEVESSQVVAALQKCEAEMPDDPVVDRMRLAYTTDPLQDATARLAEGRGYEALALFDRAIAEELEVRTSADLSVDLRLYRLYLGRAVANLCAVVARPADARRDLDLASFLRPRAAFPRVLASLLEIVESDDPAAAVERVGEQLRVVEPERRRAAGRLLRALSGLGAAADGNLMPFPLGYEVRTAIDALARTHGAPPTVAANGVTPGRAGQLQRVLTEMVAHLGETTMLRGYVQQLQDVVAREVHPQCALQGLVAAAQMLERPQSQAQLVDARGMPLSPPQQLFAYHLLVQAMPPPTLVELLLARFDAFRAGHPGLPGLLRNAALVHCAALDSTARGLASQWVAEASGDPEPYLCRLRASLRGGDLPAALDDAMVAVQLTVDRRPAIEAVCRSCELAVGEAPDAARAGIRSLLVAFKELAQ